MDRTQFQSLVREFGGNTPKYFSGWKDREADGRTARAGGQFFAGLTSRFLKAIFYEKAGQLPALLGGTYFSKKLDNIKNEMIEKTADDIVNLMLKDEVSPQRLADKLPAGMKTEEALGLAKQYGMPATAKVIEYSLNK